MRLPSSVLLLVLSVFAFVSPVTGQVTGAVIHGLVSDAQGAALPGAEVTIKKVDTGVATTTKTNASGVFEYPPVPSGTYTLTVTMSGFAPFTRTGIVLALQQRLRVDVTMALATLQQSVEVTGTPSMVDTDSASASHLITGEAAARAPLFGSNPHLITRLVAGANPTLAADGFASTSATFAPSDVSFNGTPVQGSLILVDGVVDQYGNGAMSLVPPSHSIQESRVQSFALSAEYGQSAGGVVSFETKSGTNELHGTVWFYNAQEGFNARDFFANLNNRPKTKNRRTQGGFNVGGPVLIPGLFNGKNRSFFFFDFLTQRDRVFQTFTNTVPTQQQRAGDFSQTKLTDGRLIQIYDPFTTRFNENNQLIRDPFAGNIVPQNRINAVGQKMMGFYPAPNLAGIANNYIYNYAYPHTDNQWRARFDHKISDRDSLTASFGWLKLYLLYDGAMQTRVNGYQNDRQDKLFTLGYSRIFSPTMIFNFRTGLEANRQRLSPPVAGKERDSLGFSQAFLSQLNSDVFPAVSGADIAPMGYPTQGTSFINPNIRTSLTKILNTHSLDFGYEFRVGRSFNFNYTGEAGTFAFNRDWTQGPLASTASVTAGYGAATLLLGTPSSGSININASIAAQTVYHALYVQDNWRLTRNITLNLGLRWDDHTPATERFNRVNRGFDPTVASPIEQQAAANYKLSPFPELAELKVRGGLLFAGASGDSRYVFNPRRNNFMPRLGVSYQFAQKTVVRAGVGWFYMPVYDSRPITVSQAMPPLTQDGFSASTSMLTSLNSLPADSLTNPFPRGIIQPVGSSLGLSTLLGQGVSSSDVEGRRPLSTQFQVSVQRELPSHIMTEVAYVGSRVKHLQLDQALNVISPSYYPLADGLSRAVTNPFRGLITVGSLSGATVSKSQLLLPFPQFTSVTSRFRPLGSSWYNALQVSATRRYAKSVTLFASYTFSKQMEKIRYLNIYLPLEQSLARADRPHRLVVTSLVELPFGRGRRFGTHLPRFLDWIAGSWDFDSVILVQSGQLAGAWSGAIATKPLGSVDQSIYKWFDTSAFAPLPAYTLPSLSSYNPRIRGQMLRNIDASLAKNIRLSERANFRLMVQAFNLFNTPQFAVPNVSVTSPAFGTVTAQANNPRWIMLNGVFSF